MRVDGTSRRPRLSSFSSMRSMARVDLLGADRALAQRQVHGGQQLGAFVLDAPAIFFDDGREVDVRALVGGEALVAGAALAAAADEVPVFGHPGFDDLGCRERGAQNGHCHAVGHGASC